MSTDKCPVIDSNSSECPIKSEDFNMKNMMPNISQTASNDQPFPLSKDRQVSSIPKGSSDKNENWVYPSEQMFWNAMIKKGWKWNEEDIKKEHMEHIIKIHNANNENAWNEILKWEKFTQTYCHSPKLLKFSGKASEFSPRARLRMLFGYQAPFDRHDWIIDRCGTPVRYIIDYYDVGNEYENGKFIYLDVRPAYDSFESIIVRSKASLFRWTSSFYNRINSLLGMERGMGMGIDSPTHHHTSIDMSDNKKDNNS